MVVSLRFLFASSILIACINPVTSLADNRDVGSIIDNDCAQAIGLVHEFLSSFPHRAPHLASEIAVQLITEICVPKMEDGTSDSDYFDIDFSDGEE